MWFDVQKWHDDYLMWDPEQYEAIERLNMAAGTSDARIWTPDIQLLNTYVTSIRSSVQLPSVLTTCRVFNIWVI